MSLYSICDSIQSSGLLTGVRETPWVYPIVMSIHLVCIAVFGGMILMTDLRLLGVGLKDKTVAEVVGGLRPFKRIGFVVIVSRYYADSIVRQLSEERVPTRVIGEVREGEPGVEFA